MGWKPKNAPKGYMLPAPSDRYWDMEAAREWGCTWDVWVQLDPVYRAEMRAHSTERMLRNSHFKDWEQTEMKKGKGDGAATGNTMAAQMAQWGLPVTDA